MKVVGDRFADSHTAFIFEIALSSLDYEDRGLPDDILWAA